MYALARDKKAMRFEKSELCCFDLTEVFVSENISSMGCFWPSCSPSWPPLRLSAMHTIRPISTTYAVCVARFVVNINIRGITSRADGAMVGRRDVQPSRSDFIGAKDGGEIISSFMNYPSTTR